MQILRSFLHGLSWRTLPRTLRGRARELVARLLRERASPREVGQAVAIGVWMGTSPAFGLHGWLAIGLATLLKRNRVFAWVGSRVSFFLLLPWIVISEIEVAHWVRTRELAPIDRHHIARDAATYLLDFCLGWLVLGPIYAVTLGLLSVPLWAWWQRRAARKHTAAAATLATEPAAAPRPSLSPGSDTPLPRLPPSSESLP